MKKLINCISSIDHSICNEILIFNDDETLSLKNKKFTNNESLNQKLKIFDPQDFGFNNRAFRKPIYMNKAAEISKSDKILFSDDDGIFGLNSIKLHIDALNKYQFCAGGIKRNPIIKNHISSNILQGTNISFCKEFFIQIGGYDEEFVHTGGGGDVDLWYRIYNYTKDNLLSAAYSPKSFQRVASWSTREKKPNQAEAYTKNKHSLKLSDKMYKWFPEIRDKKQWMEVIS